MALDRGIGVVSLNCELRFFLARAVLSMPRTLVDTETVAAHLADPQWVVVDCRFVLTDPEAGRRAYAQGHIPGARYAHLDEDLSGLITPTSGRHPLPDPALLARRLGAWGIDAAKQVVAYDADTGAVASRLWWLLRWLGHEAAAVLDGGLAKWSREGRALSAEPPKPVPTRFQPRVDDKLWVSTAVVARALAGGDHLLIDARAPERFRGEVEPIDAVAGHVPGARNRPSNANLGTDGCFLASEALRSQFQQLLGDGAAAPVVSMCGSGVTACHNLLAMEHAGLRGGRLYVGSWSEWIRDPRRPVAKGT